MGLSLLTPEELNEFIEQQKLEARPTLMRLNEGGRTEMTEKLSLDAMERALRTLSRRMEEDAEETILGRVEERIAAIEERLTGLDEKLRRAAESRELIMKSYVDLQLKQQKYVRDMLKASGVTVVEPILNRDEG